MIFISERACEKTQALFSFTRKILLVLWDMLESKCKRVERFKPTHQYSTTANYINKEVTELGFQAVLQIRGMGEFIGVELVKKREDTYTYGWFLIRSPEQIWGILK